MDVRVGLWRKLSTEELILWTVVLEKTLESPSTARRSSQSVLNEIRPGCSLEGLMLKLKLQYFGHLMQRAESFKKTLMLGKMRAGGEGDYRGWDGWMASQTQWTWVWVESRNWWWTGRPGVLQFMVLQSQTQLSDWTHWLTWNLSSLFYFLLLIYSKNPYIIYQVYHYKWLLIWMRIS